MELSSSTGLLADLRTVGQIKGVQALMGDDAGASGILCFRHEIDDVGGAIDDRSAEDADVRENAVIKNVGSSVEGFARRNELRMPIRDARAGVRVEYVNRVVHGGTTTMLCFAPPMVMFGTQSGCV